MDICVVHPGVTKESAGKLAKAIGASLSNPNKQWIPDADLYFNYGYSGSYLDRNKPVINPPASVRVSTDKIKSYEAFRKDGVPTCDWVEKEKDIPQSWKWIVCRETSTGRNCEGVAITQRRNVVKDCPLYTKFFTHSEEHRIVVFRGEVVARYMKANLENGQYDLLYMLSIGYEKLDISAIAAAKSVGLDYAGVDILYNNRNGKHIVLEINSGPLLTTEVEEFFTKYFKG